MSAPSRADFGSEALSWALRAVIHDLGSAAGIFGLLRDEVRGGSPEILRETADAFAEAADGVVERVAQLRALAVDEAEEPTVPLDEAVAVVLRIVGSAVRRTARLEPPTLEPVRVSAPRARVSRALIAALYGVVGRRQTPPGTLTVSVAKVGALGVVIVRGRGFVDPRVEEAELLVRTILGEGAEVAVERGPDACALRLAFPVGS